MASKSCINLPKCLDTPELPEEQSSSVSFVIVLSGSYVISYVATLKWKLVIKQNDIKKYNISLYFIAIRRNQSCLLSVYYWKSLINIVSLSLRLINLILNLNCLFIVFSLMRKKIYSFFCFENILEGSVHA